MQSPELDLGSLDWSNLESKFSDLYRLLNAPTVGSSTHKAREKQKTEVRLAL